MKDIFDLKNISRLGDTKSAFDVAIKIFDTVEKAIQKAKDELEEQEQDNDCEGNCDKPGGDSGKEGDTDTDNTVGGDDCNTGNSPSNDCEGNPNDDGEGTTGKTVKNPEKVQELDISNLTENQLKQLKKAWEN